MAPFTTRIRSAVRSVAKAIRPDAKPFRGATDELGFSRAAVIGFYPDEEKNPDSLRVDDYIKMIENDGQVAGVVRLIQYPIMAAPWEIVPAEDDKGEADFIRHLFTQPPHMGGMVTPMTHIIADMTRAIVEGYRVYEEVFYKIPIGPYAGYIGLKKLAPRDARITWLRSDDHGNFDGVRQRVFFKNAYHIIEIPKEKLLLYTFQKHKNWLYGQSALKAAWYHYDKKHKLYWIAHKAAEVSAIPPKIIHQKQTLDSAQKAAIEKAIDNLGVNSRVTIPDASISLEPYESRKGGELVNMHSLIDEHNNQISKSVLAQFIDMGAVTAHTGSRSMSQDHSELFLKTLQGTMRDMADSINSYAIPQLIDWNFGTTAYPRMEFKDITDESGELIKEAIKGMLSDPSKLPSQFVNETLARMAEELQVDYDKEAALEEITGQSEDEDTERAPAYASVPGKTPAAEGSLENPDEKELTEARRAYEKVKIELSEKLHMPAPRTPIQHLPILKTCSTYEAEELAKALVYGALVPAAA